MLGLRRRHDWLALQRDRHEAVVGGSVVSDVGGWVEYGPTTAYGSETEHGTVTVEKNQPREIFQIGIAALERSTTYHYRLCARDSQQTGGPGCGEDRQFTTVNVDCGDTMTRTCGCRRT